MALLLLLLLLVGHASQAWALAACYGMGGDQMNSNYVPCNESAAGTDGSHSACCNAAHSDICLSSGLCLNTRALALGRVLWVNGCTDKTLKDPSCPQYCQGLKNDPSDFYFLRSCDLNETVNSWCCGVAGQNISECCHKAFKLRSNIGHLVRQLDLGSSASGSAHDGGAFATPSATNIPPASSPASSSPDSKATTSGREGFIAGLSVVSTIAAVAMIALVVAVVRIRRLAHRNRELAAASGAKEAACGTAGWQAELNASPQHRQPETDSAPQNYELSPIIVRDGTEIGNGLGSPELEGTSANECMVLAELPEDDVPKH